MITIDKYPDWHLISNFEIEKVGESDDCCDVITGMHEYGVSNYDKVYWTVYQRYDPTLAPDDLRGADALADCDTYHEAEDLFNHWTEIIKAHGESNSVLRKLRGYRNAELVGSNWREFEQLADNGNYILAYSKALEIAENTNYLKPKI